MSENNDDHYWIDRAQERILKLTMPPWALGRLCDLMVDLVRIQKTDDPSVEPAAALVFAGDHGVTEEGVSAFPSEVTRQMICNFLAGGAAISVLTGQHRMPLFVVDMGAKDESVKTKSSQYIPIRLQPGTRNFLKAPAMDPETTAAAVAHGESVALRLFETASPKVVILGEMGIGNTTSAAAITALLLNAPADEVVGRGTGVDDVAYQRKVEVVRRAAQLHAGVQGKPWEVLAAVGGLEIAGMVGAILESTRRQQVILLDGFVVTAAAVVACRIDPGARQYFIAAHQSTEPGHRRLLQDMQLTPILDLGFRLGEGSGAAIAWPLLRSATLLYRQMATFEQAQVSQRP